jgi:predicted nucleotidyltransferase
MPAPLDDLPPPVRSTLEEFMAAARDVSGANLISAILFGSAAEGQLRASSDVNLLLVFGHVRLAELERLRAHLSFAHAAIGLEVMFLEQKELDVAAQAFAVKFTDILARHRVIHGSAAFESLQISRAATLTRLRQVLVNLTLRLRERYALLGQRDEQLPHLVAEVSGPIRACAAAILGLGGERASSPKEALATLAARLPGIESAPLLANISEARSESGLAPAIANETIASLLELLRAMYQHIGGWT